MAKKTEAAAIWMDPAELVPWDKNPRNNSHVVKKVADSIAQLGFGAPIVARKATNGVIAGHTRLKAAMELGLEQVPVRLLDCTEEQANQLRLADNKLGELAAWNMPMLAEVLNEMPETDLGVIGFTESELDKILAELQPPKPPEFPAFGADIEVSYTCPKCSYKWSGSKS